VQAEVTVAQAYLTTGNATAEIDRVLATSLREHRPGYLVMPTDVAASPVDRPTSPLTAAAPDSFTGVVEAFVAQARTMLTEAGSVTVLADFLADRFGARAELADLVAAGGIPHATLSLGKSVFNESDPNFVGVYSGSASEKPVLAAVEQADVLISVGVRFTDNTTTGFSQQIAPERTIDVQPFATQIGDRLFAPLPMKVAVQELTGLVREPGQGWQPSEFPAEVPADVREPQTGEALRQAQLWSAVERFLRPGDIVVAEQGTAFFGAQSVRLPADVTFIGQPLWGSIGYTLPAALGAQTAAPTRRTILLIGDGSALLTAQELGTMLREGRNPVTVLINNDGYTVERAIHGPEQRYNDIPRWNWSLVPAAMGAGEHTRTLRATTPAELSVALESVADPRGLVLLEAILPTMDLPEALAAAARAMAAANASA
jgi:indolepyruvate decarboxylase